MKLITLCFLVLASTSVFAETNKFDCVIEDNRTGDVTEEVLFLEFGRRLYAPVFEGDVASGTNAVQPSTVMAEDLTFSKSAQGDTVTVNLTVMSKNLSLTQWKYVERLRAEDTGSDLFRFGFCTSRKVN